MSAIDSLLAVDVQVPPVVLPDYFLRVIPHGPELEFERLQRLQSPGERRSGLKLLQLLGTQLTALEAYYSQAGFPLILPSADPRNGQPTSLRTLGINPNADMETILYDYIEGWKTRGDEMVLDELFIFNQIPPSKQPFPLTGDFVFSPSLKTLQQAEEGNDAIYFSSVEKVNYLAGWKIYTTFQVSHEANILREIQSCTISYWIHQRKSYLASLPEEKRAPHGEFHLKQNKRGGKLKFSGHIGQVDLNNNCKYLPWARFDQNGNLVSPSGVYIQDKKEKRPLRCDFENTLKHLIDLISSFGEQDLVTLAKLSYLKFQ